MAVRKNSEFKNYCGIERGSVSGDCKDYSEDCKDYFTGDIFASNITSIVVNQKCFKTFILPY